MPKIRSVHTLMARIRAPFRDMPSIKELIYYYGSIPAKPIKDEFRAAIKAPIMHRKKILIMYDKLAE